MFHIRNKINLFLLFLLFCGTCFGIYLTNNSGIFYNIIIMPLIGALGYFILRDIWYITLIGVFILSYVLLFIGYLLENHSFSSEIISYPLSLTFLYTLLVFLGIFIGSLLKFAFKKENLKQ